MLQLCFNSFAAIVLLMTMFSSAYGVTVYSEAINGDLSDDGLNPTAITLTAGSNDIIGTTGGATAPNTRDYFRVTVPSNLRLVSLVERAGTQAGNVGFLGVQSGLQVTLPPTDDDRRRASRLDSLRADGERYRYPSYDGYTGKWIERLCPAARPRELCILATGQLPGYFPVRFQYLLASVPEPSACGVDDRRAFCALASFPRRDEKRRQTL